MSALLASGGRAESNPGVSHDAGDPELLRGKHVVWCIDIDVKEQHLTGTAASIRLVTCGGGGESQT
jgi:hypothetical protein